MSVSVHVNSMHVLYSIPLHYLSIKALTTSEYLPSERVWVWVKSPSPSVCVCDPY